MLTRNSCHHGRGSTPSHRKRGAAAGLFWDCWHNYRGTRNRKSTVHIILSYFKRLPNTFMLIRMSLVRHIKSIGQRLSTIQKTDLLKQQQRLESHITSFEQCMV